MHVVVSTAVSFWYFQSLSGEKLVLDSKLDVDVFFNISVVVNM